MSRPIYTVLYSLMIIALFFSVSIIHQSCGNSKKDNETEDSIADKVEQVADEYTEDAFFEEDDLVDEVEPEEEISDNNVREEPSTSRSTSVTRRSNERTVSSPSQGGYLVIAGNYLLESNADNMVGKLRSAGYNNSEKVVFDLSQYYTVIAGRYQDRSVANSISSELNGKGIDNYVLRRKN